MANEIRPGKDIELKLHDGIVGALILLSVVLASTVNIQWIWLGGLVGAVMISSSFTGFCPVHFILGKILSNKK